MNILLVCFKGNVSCFECHDFIPLICPFANMIFSMLWHALMNLLFPFLESSKSCHVKTACVSCRSLPLRATWCGTLVYALLSFFCLICFVKLPVNESKVCFHFPYQSSYFMIFSSSINLLNLNTYKLLLLF